MPIEMSVQRRQPGLAIITLNGALTLGTSLHVVDTNLQNLIGAGASRLIFDLENVPFMDSAGLGTLVHANGLVQTNKGALRLCRVSERVAALLKLTRTDTLLPVDADVDASLAALNERSSAP